MMCAQSPADYHLDHTEALDVVAAEKGPLAGLAAYDGAFLRLLGPPGGSAAGPYFRDLSVRFRTAEALLTDPKPKAFARDRAAELDAIVQAMNRPR